MTTATSTFAWSNASGAAAQIWLSGVHDLLIAAGLTQTTDTGQLNTSVVPGTPTSNAVIGYQIFKFPDTLQATTPIFLKVSYQSDAANRPLVLASVASGTNGAGTMSVPGFDTPAASQNTLQSPLTSYACYVDGTFSMVLGYAAFNGVTNSNCLCAIVVDRARDATGTAISAGFLAESFGGPGTYGAQSRSLFGASSPALDNSFMPAMVPSGHAPSSSEGANVNVFRHYMMTPGVKPSLGSLTYFNAEFGALTPFTATVLGSAHTWLPMGVAMTHWSVNQNVVHCGAIRWE